MKIISFLWTVFLLFPIIMISSAFGNFGMMNETGYLIRLAICEACAISGFFLSVLAAVMKVRKIWQRNFLMLLFVSFVSYVILITLNTGAFFFIITAVSFCLGYSTPYIRDNSYTRSFFLIISLLIYSFSYSFVKKISDSDPSALFTVSMVSETFIYIFLRNKRNIDEMMEKRNYNKKYLPDNVKKSNTIFAAMFCILTGIVILARNGLSAAFIYILNLLKTFISKILSNTHDAEPEKILPESPPEPVEIPAGEEPVGGGHLIYYIIIALVILFLAVFIISNYDLIIDFIADLFISSRKKIKKFITNETGSVSQKEETGFSDSLEEIENMHVGNKRDLSSARKWKKAYSSFRSMKNGNEKYRLGYKLMLELLSLSGTKINASDTPDERAAQINENSFSDVTETYDNVRYGNKECSQSEIDRINDTLISYRKHIR